MIITATCRKINYDNIKKILILQPARLSKSLQSYQKPSGISFMVGLHLYYNLNSLTLILFKGYS